uniref:Uncharacterized protein n=1 Tax=Avena sativa TaxID=4498 RepID=A0ACD5VW22_AVESA
MASSSSSIVIRIPPQANDGEITLGTAGMAPTTPKDAAGSTTASAAAGPSASATDKVMSTAANLAQLLPTGTVLAYQALSPSFTNHGKCETSNQWLTAALVVVLTASCLFFALTDSVLGSDQKLYYGVATWGGFNVFNFSSEEEKGQWGADQFRKLRLRPLDFVHSFFTAVVFLTVAFSDVGLQNCFFPEAGKNTEELLKNLPLGMAFLSSFVFIIFPTKRKSIGYNDTTPRQKLKVV